MTTENSYPSLFRKLVVKEDEYTQVLCNLMVRYDEFRAEILALFEDSRLASQIAARHLSTQVAIKEHGRPDLIIDSPAVFALLEVKLNDRLGLTAHQTPVSLDEGEVRNYFSKAAKAGDRHKAVFFLVPVDWKPRRETQEALDKLKARTQIETKIVSWRDVLSVAERLRGAHPGVDEFYTLLQEKLGPLKFSERETAMLFQIGYPARETLKVCHLVDQIKEKCKGLFPKTHGPGFDKDGEQYGMEFYGPDRKYLFWFGLWSPFWTEIGKPLCFGVSAEVSPKVKTAFMAAYHGPFEEFGDYTVGWIPEEDLVAGNGGAVDKVWNRLEPIFKAVRDASS